MPSKPKKKIVKAWAYLWPEDNGDITKGKIVFYQLSKETIEKLKLTEIFATITYTTITYSPNKTRR